MRTFPDVDLVTGNDQDKVRLRHAVLEDGCSEQVVLKALEKLTRSELSQEVGRVLDVGGLPIGHIRGVALHLPLCMCVYVNEYVYRVHACSMCVYTLIGSTMCVQYAHGMYTR